MASRHPVICRYEVDAQYRLVQVDDAWVKFAIENGAPELAHPVGDPERTLFSYIADDTTKQMYRAMFARVRAEERSITVPLRCDAPRLRRLLELTIAPRENGGFLLESALVRSEPRPYLALLDAARRRTQELIRMCGWCKAVDAYGRWVEPEHGVQLLNLFELDALPEITHGICEACHARLAGTYGEPA